MSEDQGQGQADPFGTGPPPSASFLREPAVLDDPPGGEEIATPGDGDVGGNGQPAAISSEQFNKLQDEFTGLQKSFRDTQAWAMRSKQERDQAISRADQLSQTLQQQANLANTAAAWEIPDPEDPNRFLEDPNAVTRYVKQTTDMARRQVLGAVMPAYQRVQAMEQEMGSLRKTAVAVSRQQARDEWRRSGYDPDAFDEVQPDIDSWIENDQNAVRQLSDPNNMIVAAQHFARQRGRSIAATPSQKKKAASNLSTPTGPPAQRAKSGLTDEERRQARMVEEMFGLEPGTTVKSVESKRQSGTI